MNFAAAGGIAPVGLRYQEKRRCVRCGDSCTIAYSMSDGSNRYGECLDLGGLCQRGLAPIPRLL